MAAFGAYLREARLAAGFKKQSDAAQALAALGRGASQSLIAQYETGRIKDPDPESLYLLAKIYRKDYMELVLNLVREKYEENMVLDRIRGQRKSKGDKYDGEKVLQKLRKLGSHGLEPSGIGNDIGTASLSGARWKLFAAGLKRYGEIGGVTARELEEVQLIAKANLLEGRELLDVDGLALWERTFPQLKTVWVVALQPLDADEKEIHESVIGNLQQGVTYAYFGPPEHDRKGGWFFEFKRTLEQEPRLTDAKIVMEYVPIDERAYRELGSDYVIANPQRPAASVGFQCFREHGRPIFGLRLLDRDLDHVIKELRDRFYDHVKESERADRALPAMPVAAIVRHLAVAK
jgi:transcriptional regulator with XRE-family HTH domain